MFGSTPTNGLRAHWAEVSLDAFPAADGDLTTNAKDLITNLLHLVRRNWEGPGDFDAAAFAQAAAQMHDIEVAEDQED